MSKTILTKIYSREHTLSYCYVWYLSDKLAYNVKNTLFIRQADSNRVDVWYDNEEINGIISKLIKKINETDYLQEIIKIFYDQWQLILPILSGQKKINSLEELEDYFNSLTKWWSAMAIITVAPDSAELKSEIKEKFLAMRKETEIYTDKQDEIFQHYLKNEFPRLKDVAYVISPLELFKSKGKFDDNDIQKIEQRLNGFFLANDQVFLLKDLPKFMEKNNMVFAEEKAEFENNLIKGQIAFMGRVKGTAHIILNKEDLKNFKKGEVLVTEMTSPDFLSALKIASAIITNEGGITCHAAIVARELKKPCIIGTKIATKVLKDRDMVEVDANSGIVKILSK